VICHAGSGPNSGHYYSFVKGDQPNDPFYEINDEMVERAGTISEKSAYILFYQIQKGDSMRQLSFLTQVGATEAYAQERRNHAKPGVTDMIPATVTTPSIKKQGRIETPIPQSVILQEKIRKLEARRSAQGPAASTDEVVSNAEAHDGQVELGESMKLDASQLSEDIGEPIVSQSPSPLKRPPEKSEEMDQAKKQRLSSPLEFNISRGLDLAFTGYTDTTKSHLIFSSSTNTQINKPKGVKQRMKKKSIMM
jgi:ubiquitin carboxyl-terminal hydrolase 36/42